MRLHTIVFEPQHCSQRRSLPRGRRKRRPQPLPPSLSSSTTRRPPRRDAGSPSSSPTASRRSRQGGVRNRPLRCEGRRRSAGGTGFQDLPSGKTKVTRLISRASTARASAASSSTTRRNASAPESSRAPACGSCAPRAGRPSPSESRTPWRSRITIRFPGAARALRLSPGGADACAGRTGRACSVGRLCLLAS